MEDLKHFSAVNTTKKEILMSHTIGDKSSISTINMMQWRFCENIALDYYTRQVLLSHSQSDSTGPYYSVCCAYDDTISIPSNSIKRTIQ